MRWLTSPKYSSSRCEVQRLRPCFPYQRPPEQLVEKTSQPYIRTYATQRLSANPSRQHCTIIEHILAGLGSPLANGHGPLRRGGRESSRIQSSEPCRIRAHSKSSSILNQVFTVASWHPRVRESGTRAEIQKQRTAHGRPSRETAAHFRLPRLTRSGIKSVESRDSRKVVRGDTIKSLSSLRHATANSEEQLRSVSIPAAYELVLVPPNVNRSKPTPTRQESRAQASAPPIPSRPITVLLTQRRRSASAGQEWRRPFRARQQRRLAAARW